MDEGIQDLAKILEVSFQGINVAFRVTKDVGFPTIKAATKVLNFLFAEPFKKYALTNTKEKGRLWTRTLVAQYGSDISVGRIPVEQYKTFTKNCKKLGVPFAKGPKHVIKDSEGKEVEMQMVLYPRQATERVEEAFAMVREAIKDEAVKNQVGEMNMEDIAEVEPQLERFYPDVVETIEREELFKVISPRSDGSIRNAKADESKTADKETFVITMREETQLERLRQKDVVFRFQAEQVVGEDDSYLKVVSPVDYESCVYIPKRSCVCEGNEYVAAFDKEEDVKVGNIRNDNTDFVKFKDLDQLKKKESKTSTGLAKTSQKKSKPSALPSKKK